ncbi:MAG: glycyl-radical enzyme activating protein [Ruminococcaceae bacterium]|nr:glycyl-radical enzyme activating protein [Oscillospiraceae bacterium]
MKATIFDIQRCSFSDGPGIRTTVFFKGCNLRCAWCHNPESQSPKSQLMFHSDKCTSCGKCREVCPNALASCDLCGRCEIYCPAEARRVCGKEYTPDEVLSEILKDKKFYETSGGGVTFSGGEAMLQTDFLVEILKRCKDNGIHTAVDTAGHHKWQVFERILPYTDLFLYDLKAMDSEIHKKYVGVDNVLILENLAKLLEKDIPVFIRVPVIPSVNDTRENMLAMKEFFARHGDPKKTELLPYHRMGEGKSLAIGKEPMIFDVPSKEHINELYEYLKR